MVKHQLYRICFLPGFIHWEMVTYMAFISTVALMLAFIIVISCPLMVQLALFQTESSNQSAVLMLQQNIAQITVNLAKKKELITYQFCFMVWIVIIFSCFIFEFWLLNMFTSLLDKIFALNLILIINTVHLCNESDKKLCCTVCI